MAKYQVTIPFYSDEIATLFFFFSTITYFISLSSFSLLPDPAPPVPRSALHITRDVAVVLSGAVGNPGVYYIEKGSSNQEAAGMAGITGESDPKWLNNKKKITKATKLVVPAKRESKSNSIGKKTANTTGKTTANTKKNKMSPAGREQ
jgi:hypothetical protein